MGQSSVGELKIKAVDAQLFVGSAVEVGVGLEALSRPADDGQLERGLVLSCAGNRFRAAANGQPALEDPFGLGVNLLVHQGRAVAEGTDSGKALVDTDGVVGREDGDDLAPSGRRCHRRWAGRGLGRGCINVGHCVYFSVLC